MAQTTALRKAIHSLAFHRQISLTCLRDMTERQLAQLFRDIKPT